jgi:hypothetical protein
MEKKIKYIAGIVIAVLLVYNSVYFKKLSEVNAEAKQFDAAAYARQMVGGLLTDTAAGVNIDSLISLVKTDQQKSFEQYGHALAIGSTRYFLIKGQGVVKTVNREETELITEAKNELRIATEFVFGNAIRDASGKVKLNDFTNTTDLNNISSEANKIIRAEVLPSFKLKVQPGDTVAFTGAIELNQAHTDVVNIEVIPVRLALSPAEDQR